MSSPYESERTAAIEAVRHAAELCRRVQSRMVTADSLTKKDRSPVTVADFGSQALVARHLEGVFPDDPMVGEESADSLRQDEQSEIRSRVIAEVQESVASAKDDQILSWIDRGSHEGGVDRFWTLDPIDGTKGFLRGEQYAVALALVVKGQVEVALLGCPNLPLQWGGERGAGSLFVAERGKGAVMMSLDGGEERSIQASPCQDITKLRALESVEAAHGDHSSHDQIKSRLGIRGESVRLDSQAKYGVLSRGEAEIYLRMPTKKDYRECIWDQAAGSLVIEEAGGKVTDARGKPLDFTTGRRLQNNLGIIASHGPFHDQIVAAAREVMPDELG